MSNAELIIQNGSSIIYPVVEEGISWETERKGSPGKLAFTVLKDEAAKFEEGNAVRLKFGDSNVFYGFVFKMQRDKSQQIKVTVYDQLRYFKNKDTYIYKDKTANELIKMIAEDFNLQVGTLEDTGYKIPSRVEDNKTLFDIAQTALDETLTNKNKMYVLYDDFGKLTLKNIESMKLDLLIDEETGENFDYTSSIDEQTYNKIKLSYENKDTGKREIYIAQHGENMNKWGVLQYFETLDTSVNGKAKADALLKLYNQKTRNLSISDAFGDVRIRAGTTLIVKLDLGDISLQNYMMVEKASHTFKKDDHRMNLTLRGGEFIA